MTRAALLVIFGCGTSLGVASWRWNHALPIVVPTAGVLPGIAPVSVSPVIDDSVESAFVERDMFRLTGIEADRRDGVIASTAAPATRSASRPMLGLKAIVGGPPWRAIVDGIPGQAAGAIVQSGSTFDGLIIVAVGRDSVRVRVSDSAWTLYYRRGQ